jgi:GntR family transcriptional regulator, rspAB operon transcriptional repressor
MNFKNTEMNGNSKQSNGASGGNGDFQTLANKIYLLLQERIASGDLVSGTRLVRRTLAKEFEVSPIPVTEALYRLEQDGLVESAPMYGARVKVWTLDALKNDQVLREALECQAARLCAENATDAQLATLLKMAKELDVAIRSKNADSREGMHQHLDFHLSVARMGGYRSIEEEVHRIWRRRLMRWNWVSAKSLKIPADWHQQLVLVFKKRDADAAEAKMRAHVRYGQARDAELLKSSHVNAE